jgi:hypothetical protein
MTASLASVDRSKLEWWRYLILMLVILPVVAFFLMWKVTPGLAMRISVRLSPFHVATPKISGTVVDVVTGRPVPGLDVCLLATLIRPNGMVSRATYVMRSAVTQTDASGVFSFARWDDQLDLFEHWGGYGIAVTDPTARGKESCGQDIYLLGREAQGGDVFRREIYFQSLPDSAAKSTPPPYFPVALVKDPYDPHPLVYGLGGSYGYFPDGTLVRKIGNTSKLTIAVVPLLREIRECQLAHDSDSAEMCRQMNQSLQAYALRTSWRMLPQGR